MTDNGKTFEKYVRKEGSLPFKEKLLAFRALHMDEFIPNISKPARGRLGDILKPIFQMAEVVYPEKEELLFKFVEKSSIHFKRWMN